MPTERLFFGNDQRSGNQELAGASPLAVNVLVDGTGAVRRRPGISAWAGFPGTAPAATSIIGISSFAGHIYYVTDTRRIFRVTPATASYLEMSAIAEETLLDGSRRPVFAETPYRLVIAGGGALEKVDRNATTAERLGGSPPDATQVMAANQRLFVDNESLGTVGIGRIQYSQAGDAGNETWPTLNFKIAEGDPDDIVALKGNGNETFAFGERTLQIYSPDSSVVIAPGRSLNKGCAAADSVVAVDEGFAWLDEQRNLVLSDGRSMNELSAPIAGTLDSIADVSTCWGFRYLGDQFSVLGWVFGDGRTFAFQQGGGWGQWHGYTESVGHAPLPITSHYYWPAQNLNLVGLASGKIGKFDHAAETDLGARIKAEVSTGFIHHNTDAYKHCEVIRFTFKRGQSTAPAPQVLVSYRDNMGAFCSPKRLTLGATGDNIFTQEMRSVGTYRSRQWKVEFSEAADFVLARAEETFAVGGTN